MGITTERQTIERLQFFTGQRLFVSDIQAIDSFNREMRWLHNQSLHQPGIGMGFLVSGEVGDRKLAVTSGYAIDSLGREIVHPQKSILPIPPIADDGFGNSVNYDLAISYIDDSVIEEAETIEKIQLPNKAIRLREEPMFHWVELDRNLQPKDDKLKLEIKNGLKLILKRIGIKNCRLKRIYTDLKVRKAQSEKLPFIFAGKNCTYWEFWELPNLENPIRIGLRTFVDTTCANFSKPPHYFARVAGKRSVVYSLLEGLVQIKIRQNVPFEKGFELLLMMPELSVGDLTANPWCFFYKQVIEEINDLLLESDWHIVWMGIED